MTQWISVVRRLFQLPVRRNFGLSTGRSSPEVRDADEQRTRAEARIPTDRPEASLRRLASATLFLELRNGTRIDDPIGEVLRFIEEDTTYRSYDAVTAVNDLLSASDVRLANRMIARMGPSEIAGIMARRTLIESALQRISPTTTLTSADGEIGWDDLHRLYSAFDGLRGVGVARMTKVLHKKRPKLIPILDEVVSRYLEAVEAPVAGGMADRATALTQAYRRELLHCEPVLSLVRQQLAERGFELTDCRLLDIFLWAYSGTYEPIWMRSRGEAGGRVSLRTGGSRGTDSHEVEVPDGVDRFSHDDDGFQRWTAAHPEGYVLNCAHRPRPDYLKLHRVRCRHLQLDRVQQWTEAYAKVCSTDVGLLAAWAEGTTGGTVDWCPACFR